MLWSTTGPRVVRMLMTKGFRLMCELAKPVLLLVTSGESDLLRRGSGAPVATPTLGRLADRLTAARGPGPRAQVPLYRGKW